MGYYIEAFIDEGKPNLRIYDSDQGKLCLSWTYAENVNERRAEQEVHRLFRELLLLTCKQDLRNVRVFRLSDQQII